MLVVFRPSRAAFSNWEAMQKICAVPNPTASNISSIFLIWSRLGATWASLEFGGEIRRDFKA